MPDSNAILTRQELFDLVWTKPATHIAKDFGVQPAMVLKACSLLNIPRPTTGHWVKLEHGQAVAKPALPPAGPKTPGSTSFGALIGRHKRMPRVDSPPVAATAAGEGETIKWHPAVQKTRVAHRGGGVDYKYGTINSKPEFPTLNLSATRDSLDRAYLILNRLAWSLEEQGFTFLSPDKGGLLIRLVYSATDTEIAFQLREEVERYERELKPEEKGKDPIYIWNRWRYRATGRLRLLISEYHPERVQKSWGDGKNTKLEDKLADAAPGFVICAQGKHAQKLEWDARQRRWDEEARIREEEAARKRKEQERRNVLIAAAKKWKESAELQAFRSACETRLRSTASDGQLTPIQFEWLTWVDSVIREMNPLTDGFLARLEQPQGTVEEPPSA